MRQKANKDTAEAVIRKAIDVWDCGRWVSDVVIVDWRTWMSSRVGVECSFERQCACEWPGQSLISLFRAC